MFGYIYINIYYILIKSTYLEPKEPYNKEILTPSCFMLHLFYLNPLFKQIQNHIFLFCYYAIKYYLALNLCEIYCCHIDSSTLL